MLSFILIAEIALHFGFKAVKYVINVFRGSGAWLCYKIQLQFY
jgi:hypothetical protein